MFGLSEAYNRVDNKKNRNGRRKADASRFMKNRVSARALDRWGYLRSGILFVAIEPRNRGKPVSNTFA